MIGRDSVFGGSIALDGQTALNTAIIQIPGAVLARALCLSASYEQMV